MIVVRSQDVLRFPPAISAEIAAEIEAIAWSHTDLLRDIPDHNPDAMYLAFMYADAAAEIWARDNDCPPGYLPQRIIDAARRALVPRIEEEIERRDRLVRDEYDRRLRHGRIDVNGAGDMPSYYDLEDVVGPAARDGRKSEPTGWMSPERPRRFGKKGSDMMNTDAAKAMRAARLWLAWSPLKVEPCPAAVADAITEWAEAVVGAEARMETPAATPSPPQVSKSRRSTPKKKALTEDEIRRQATFKLPIDGGKKSDRPKENVVEQPAAERPASTRRKAS